MLHVQMRFIGPMVLSPNIFFVFIYIIIPVFLFYRTKALPLKTYNSDFISKDNTNLLRGVCVLLILTHHFSQQLFEVAYLRPFKYIGVYAVALFFFLSSYGMTVSLKRNPDYLKNFLFKRFSKIYIPYMIINAITVIIMVLFYDASYTALDVVLFVSGLKLVDASLWFVHRILIYYVVFYLSFKFFSKKTALILVCLFTIVYCAICYKLGRGIWEFRTAFSFPLGIFFALNNDKIFKIATKYYIRIAALCAVCFAVSTYLYGFTKVYPSITSALAAGLFIILILLLLMKVKISSKPFSFLGTISYEIYLIHMKVLIITYSLVQVTQSYYLYIYLVSVSLIAYLYNRTFKLNFQSKLKKALNPAYQ